MKVFSLTPPTDLKDDYYKTNGTYVQGSIKWWSVIITICYLIACGVYIAQATGHFGNATNLPFKVTITSIGFFAWALLLIGSLMLIWILYIPAILYTAAFTVLMAVLAASNLINAVSVILMNLKQYGEYLKDRNTTVDEHQKTEAAFLALGSVVYLLIILFFCYILSVVVRACQRAYLYRKNKERTT
ncbi:hypothetical protein M3Y97_01093400 [Aphelenchoides bicaudatus]|nr:hypothetical protein M3Y97_01093400 [Aphelenchoides bicaudatus]